MTKSYSVFQHIFVLMLLSEVNAFSMTLGPTTAPRMTLAAEPAQVQWAKRPFMRDNFASHITEAVREHANTISQTLASSPTAVCCIDGFLGEAACRAMREEAEAVRAAGKLEDCESSGDVRATQVDFQLSQELKQSFLLTHTLTVTRELAPIINELSPKANLSPSAQTNKLAVVEKDGSAYARHVDNSFLAGDVRKLTVLYYLNPDYEEEYGGRFRAFDCRGVRVSGDDRKRTAKVGQEKECASFAPRGDRLMIFWTDSLVHDVAPSSIGGDRLPSPDGTDSTPADSDRHRWALTTWMVTTEPKTAIAAGVRDSVLRRHFRGSAVQREFQRLRDKARRAVTGTSNRRD